MVNDVSDRGAHYEAVTLGAYRDALAGLPPSIVDRRALLALIGDIEEQVSRPALSTRLTLAGRLIATAQRTAPEPLPEPEVQHVVRAWIAQRGAERDDAAPSSGPRREGEPAALAGLNRSVLESDRHGDLSRTAWAIAAVILQHHVRPPMEVDRSLALSARLETLAAAAMAMLHDPSPFGLANGELDELLARTVVHARSAARVAVPWEKGPQEDWLHIAAATAGAHARWDGQATEHTMQRAVGRATERLASSLVPDEPERFPIGSALEHAVRCAFDAAVTALGLNLHPDDPVLAEIKPDVLDGLLEATSSALIGAWVIERRT